MKGREYNTPSLVSRAHKQYSVVGPRSSFQSHARLVLYESLVSFYISIPLPDATATGAIPVPDTARDTDGVVPDAEQLEEMPYQSTLF